MIDSKKKESPVTNQAEAPGSDDRRPYQGPRLLVRGDLRDVTLGLSPGMGDSNNPMLLEA